MKRSGRIPETLNWNEQHLGLIIGGEQQEKQNYETGGGGVKSALSFKLASQSLGKVAANSTF